MNDPSSSLRSSLLFPYPFSGRNSTFFILLFCLCLSSTLSAQKICEEEITLTSQADVDQCDCTEITGALLIQDGSESDPDKNPITNLDALS